eukprot:Gb_39273 [translate_table: standard]
MAIEIAMTATTSSGSAGGPSGPNPMQAWWEGIAKARSRIQALVNILGPLNSLESLQDSERPAKGLLESEEIANNICTRLDDPSSGSGGDQLCQWFYETFQTGDPDLQLVVLRYVPVLAGIYLSRVVAKSVEEPLAGFEAVMLALYTAETKARGGRPLVINIPDLGQPSLYHAPRNPSSNVSPQPFVGQLSAPLEPQVAVKSTKRACIVGVALDLFFRKIASMPSRSKVEICEYAEGWAGQNCSCARKFDQMGDGLQLQKPRCGDSGGIAEVNGEEIAENSPTASALEIDAKIPNDKMGKFSIQDTGSANGSPLHKDSSGTSSPSNPPSVDCPVGNSRAKGARIPLSWELLQPILRILGHCLLAPLNSQEVKDAASSATRVVFARVSHDLVPEAILATRSLIHLDIAARATAMATAAANAAMTATTPTKPKKPEILLVSK